MTDAEKEILALRLRARRCPYGHADEQNVCSLGIPGCACADDQVVYFDTYGDSIAGRRETLIEELRATVATLRAQLATNLATSGAPDRSEQGAE
jgi:hypothetical protein